MKRPTALLSGSALLLSYMAFVVWIFCLSVVQNHCTEMAVAPALPAAFLITVFFLNSVLAGRVKSLSLYIAIQLPLAAAGVWLLLRSVDLSPGGIGTRIFLAALYVCGVVLSAYTAVEGVKQRTLVFCFDALAILTAILLFLDHYISLLAVRPTLILCVAAMALTLLAMLTERVHREDAKETFRGNAGAGRLLVAALLALIALFTALVAAFAAGGLRSVAEVFLAAARWCLGILKAAGAFLTGLIERFMIWIGRFMPDTPVDEAPSLGVSGADTVLQGGELHVPPTAGYVAGVLLLAAIFVLLFVLRRRRMTAKLPARRARPSTQVRQSGLSAALARFCSTLRRKAAYRVNRIRFRGTAAGLLAWCEQKTPREARRRKNESGGQFLLRLAAGQSDAAAARALTELAGLVERSFYSADRPSVSKELYQAILHCKF